MASTMRMTVKRGDVFWVDWNPSRGSEQSGRRPALVIQNDTGNRSSPTTIVAAITTAVRRPYPFLVNITAAESGLTTDSTVNLSAILTVDQTRLRDKCDTLSEARMHQVDEAIGVSLGL